MFELLSPAELRAVVASVRSTLPSAQLPSCAYPLCHIAHHDRYSPQVLERFDAEGDAGGKVLLHISDMMQQSSSSRKPLTSL